jgi:hypothetical protein
MLPQGVLNQTAEKPAEQPKEVAPEQVQENTQNPEAAPRER